MAIVVNTDEVYKQLKKQNGEGVARVIRDAVLLDVPNVVHILEFAGHDADNVNQLVPVIREIYKGKPQPEIKTNKDPLELLNEAGYDAFVVKTEKQKNSIAKYYRPGEEICTFRDPNRHLVYHMIHAIKHGADKIKPLDHPERQDEYGTSVISIQILKGGGFISIKNRYNHTVPNPDATFNSNPDNIIPGLSYALKKYFQVDFYTSDVEMPSMYRMVNDQLVYYNYEVYDTYFGDDYYCRGSTITKLDKNSQVLFYTGFVLTIAKGNNSVESVTETQEEFCTELNDFLHDKKIRVSVDKETKTRTIFVDEERFMDLTPSGLISFIHIPKIDELHLDPRGLELSGDLDFMNTTDLCLDGADLSNVKSIKVNPHALIISLENAILAGNVDLSTHAVTYINLKYADFSHVRSIKLNYFTYRAIKHYPVAFLGGHIELQKLPALGVKIKFSNPFSLAKRTVQSYIDDIKFKKASTKRKTDRHVK